MLSLLFMVGCQTIPIVIETKDPVNSDQGIQRAAVFLLIMRGEPWGKKELAAEVEFLKYLLELNEKPNGRNHKIY